MSKTYNEALLQRVEEYLASSGLSQNKMAQAVGLSQTALSNWRRKIYNGDPAYVEGKLKEYFETQAAREAVEEQAAPYLSDTGYVPTTVSEDIYKGIKFAQLERGMVVLHGDAGIGKTEGARKFLHDYPHNTVFITATPTTGSLNCIIKLLARALFPRLADEKRDKELDFLFGIAKGRWGVRGAKTVYNNSVRNENVSYDGLYSMAVHLGVGWN